MTIELVLLMIVTLFVLLTFSGKSGPGAVFQESGPRLGARIERQLATGRGFLVKEGGSGQPGTAKYTKPPGEAPTSEFK
jgi:hypothetical protein